MKPFLSLCIALILSACGAKAPTPTFHEAENPKILSDWGMVAAHDGALFLGEGTIEYDLKTPLFSDYALKLRTIHIPKDGQASVGEDGDVIEFPVGTIISKTFYYPKGDTDNKVLKPVSSPVLVDGKLELSDLKLIETRLLVHRLDGWHALPYVWNEDQTEATLERIGDLRELTLVDGETKSYFPYIVPNVNQCAGCHATNATTKKIVPIGPKLRHLNSVEGWGLSNMPSTFFENVNWMDDTASLDNRARAYLDINCSHCHNKVGPADTSGLHLEPSVPTGPNLGICKMPIAAGTGTGNRKYGIVPGAPEKSIFAYRMGSTNPAVMMPELGRSLPHAEGLALIEDWITAMDGDCDAG